MIHAFWFDLSASHHHFTPTTPVTNTKVWPSRSRTWTVIDLLLHRLKFDLQEHDRDHVRWPWDFSLYMTFSGSPAFY